MSEDNDKIASLETNCKFVLSTAFSVDSKLASSGVDGISNIFDLEKKQIVHKIEAHALPARSNVFSPNGALLYTASDDRHVSVYDTRSGRVIQSFSHPGMALSVDASGDQRHFIVGCADHAVYQWDLGMQKCIGKYGDCHSDMVWGVRYLTSKSVKSTDFVSVGDDGVLQTYL